jgi:hypothetical protein
VDQEEAGEISDERRDEKAEEDPRPARDPFAMIRCEERIAGPGARDRSGEEGKAGAAGDPDERAASR